MCIYIICMYIYIYIYIHTYNGTTRSQRRDGRPQFALASPLVATMYVRMYVFRQIHE